jgi:hypothetical protein
MPKSTQLFQAIRPEERIVQAVMSNGDVKLTMPKTATPTEIYDQLLVCARAYKLLDKAKERVGPLIGKLSLVARENPEVWRERGIETWKDFTIHLEEVSGFKRSELYRWERAMRNWPSAVDKHPEIGIHKWDLLSQMGLREKDSSAPKMLEKAKDLTLVELRVFGESKGFLEQGESIPSKISFGAPLSLAHHWSEFWHHPKVVETVGSDNQADIFLAMIQECSGSWGV